MDVENTVFDNSSARSFNDSFTVDVSPDVQTGPHPKMMRNDPREGAP